MSNPQGVREFFIIPGGPTCLIAIQSDIERQAIELISLHGELSLVEDQNRRDGIQAAINRQVSELRETILKANILEKEEQDPDDAPGAHIGFL
jgi:hypothetical protein